jgi:hypothetical protein
MLSSIEAGVVVMMGMVGFDDATIGDVVAKQSSKDQSNKMTGKCSRHPMCPGEQVRLVA